MYFYMYDCLVACQVLHHLSCKPNVVAPAGCPIVDDKQIMSTSRGKIHSQANVMRLMLGDGMLELLYIDVSKLCFA